MARAYGSTAHLLMKRETVYGQAATGNYIRMPFNPCNLGSEEGGQTARLEFWRAAWHFWLDHPVFGNGIARFPGSNPRF